ncbi:MAG: enoyl-CoA hydratase/isomerase family protein [Deltaproteobacteria bacterium]|nr:enoyl-CoA hydratase/isomerase family protein [Deltaproteobacteria bacterium]
MDKHIRYEIKDRIATIVIDRPEKKNAMTFAMLDAFHEAVAEAGQNENVWVLIVRGSGGAFCAGIDLADLQATPEDRRGGEERKATPWPLLACPKPVIAAIDGAAVGMGAEFTSQCDVRIASTRTRFAWNFVHRGLVPDMGAGSWLLPRLIGLQPALRLLYSGDFLHAPEALAIGYVSRVLEPDQVAGAAWEEAQRFLQGSPFSIRRIKRLVYEGLARSPEEHIVHHRKALDECFHSHDHAEGIASFLERRPPQFTGR